MSRRSLLSVFAAIAVVVAVAAPAGGAITVGWSVSVADTLASVAVDSNGNSYVVGRKNEAATLIKYSPSGTKLWTRTWLPASASWSYSVAVAVGPGGAVFWAGNVGAPGCEGSGWFVRRVRADGGFVWHRDQPGWEGCKTATGLTDLDVGDGLLAFTIVDGGCCADPYQNGKVRALTLNGSAAWAVDFEPPAGVPAAYYDRATGVAVSALDTVYVGGWAATQSIPDDMVDYRGIVVIQKVSSGGTVLWRKKVLRVPYTQTDALVAVRGTQLMLTTQSRGQFLTWGSGTPPEAWLGRFTLDGGLVWWKTWGTDWNFAAQPTQLAIDSSGATWVVGTRRDPSDKGYDLFVRKHATGGNLMEFKVMDGPTKHLEGTGVASRGTGAMVTGWVGVGKWGDPDGGRLWRLV